MSPRGVLFTDLDGTLLDPYTYRPSTAAVEAIRWLADAGVVTVPVSSKTAAEVIPLLHELPLGAYGVAEGGAVIIRNASEVEIIGKTRADLVGALQRLRELGWPAHGLSGMSVEEVIRRTGLSKGDALRAMDRLASEPFVLTGKMPGDPQRDLPASCHQLGVHVARGGRFWHLSGAGVDKGSGVRRVLRDIVSQEKAPTAAIGDAWNDLAMLAATDLRLLLGDAVGSELIPDGVVRIAETGPVGFVLATRVIAVTWDLGAGPDP